MNARPAWKRWLVSIFSFGTLGGIFIWKWKIFCSYPLTSLLAVLGAALGGIALGFGKKVWTELEERWVKSCAEWADFRVRLIFSGFRRRYLKQLGYRHRVFNVRGLRTQGTFTLELDRVFIELRISPQNPQKANTDILQKDVMLRSRTIWEYLSSEVDAYKCLAIIGPPGCGKTTLIQHVVLTFSQDKQRRYNSACPTSVPILLFLREHVQEIASNTPPSLDEVCTTFEKREHTDPPEGWFRQKLDSGKCTVLFDGLDEVGDPQARKKVVAWIEKQVSRYPENRFIITSRTLGYQTNPLVNATVLEVQPFTMQQVERFVDNWYLVNEILSFGKDDPGVRRKAAKDSADLMDRLRNAPMLAAMAVNPLLMTMIAMVHRYRGALPGRRVELYAEICDVLLGHWQAARGIVSDLTAAQKRTVLQPLALHLMRERKREASCDEAASSVSEALARVIQKGNESPQLFLREVQERSGLLLEKEAGTYHFAHLTFQEYLAASEVLGGHDERILLENVEDTWWHETLRLYAAQADATNIIRACLKCDPPSVLALKLAFECELEARTVDPQVRQQLRQRLIDGVESSNNDYRKIASEVVLALRIGKLLRLSNSVDIDTSNISCAEYQLFLNDLVVSGQVCHPHHWDGLRFSPGRGLKPISGVRKRDGIAFCSWLSQWAAKMGFPQATYRLINAQEFPSSCLERAAPDPVFDGLRDVAIGAWSSGEHPILLGIPDSRMAQFVDALHGSAKKYLNLARALSRENFSIITDRLGRKSKSILRDYLERAHVLENASQIDLARLLGPNHVLDTVLDHAPIEDAEFQTLRSGLLVSAYMADADWRRAISMKDLGALRQPIKSQRVDRLLRMADNNLDIRNQCIDAFLALVLFEERRKGALPAWEGIRIARERSAGG